MWIRRELESGLTRKGSPLDAEQVQERLARLSARVLALPARYRQAEQARIRALEARFLGHLAAAAEGINAHTTAALAPIAARLEGRVPERRAGQTATERKQEIDKALLATRLLREERKRLVQEERQERAAKRRRPRAEGSPDPPV